MFNNEMLFLLHALVVFAFLLAAVRLGKMALSFLIGIGGILANLFVLKQISFFSLTITCSDVFIIQCLLGLNLMQELYGKEEAKRASNASFFLLIFFMAMAKIHLLYQASSLEVGSAFDLILSSTPRLVIASVFVFFLVQKIDIAFFSFLKRAFPEKGLGMRSFMSLFVTQAIDTVLFSFLGLYGLVDQIFDVMLVSFLVKVLVMLASTPFLTLSKRVFRAV